MSLIGGDGFDMYNGASAEIGYLSKWSNIVTRAGTDMTAGRFGGQAFRVADGTGNISQLAHNLGAAYGTFCIGFAFRWTPRPNGDVMLFTTGLNSGNQLYLSHGTNQFTLRRGDGTVLITSTFTTTANQWCYVEIAFTIANSGGYAEMWINGASQGSFSGDTQQQAGSTFQFIEVRSPNDTGAGNVYDFDDMYWKDDLTPLGEIRVATIRAVADTADADFVPVGASPNSACVDETLVDGDTTYVQGSNSGDLDLYQYEAVPGDPSAIYGLQLVTFAKKTDAGARTLEAVLDSNGSIDTGPAVSLLTTYDRYDHVVELNPDGSVPWTKPTVDAILVGPQIP